MKTIYPSVKAVTAIDSAAAADPTRTLLIVTMTDQISLY